MQPMRGPALLLAATLGSCAFAPPAYAPRPAAELVGRVAGAPQHCVAMEPDGALHVDSADRSTLIYGRGRTIWANNVAPCSFNPQDVLVMHPNASSYCQGDIVRSVESAGIVQGPSCILGPWVPFRT